jgi:hypothetical protein
MKYGYEASKNRLNFGGEKRKMNEPNLKEIDKAREFKAFHKLLLNV